ncbi:type II toxin-antitoxin system ParD family antitoxin [uncultured Roseibium sp.]|uniref:type II toxin-antitoxin system ParD family antitoxin n=1 Tax=uncultured Roseibium sp. TaxID=1936171 RepID=UPI003216BED2
MARNTSLSLGDHFAGFIDNRVKTGRYASASDVIRAGLRLLEEQETRIDTLRSALEAGEASGKPQDFDFDDFIERKSEA